MSQQGPIRQPAFFTQVDISQVGSSPVQARSGASQEIIFLLQQILAAQDRQNKLLEELINHVTAPQRQRAMELNQWRQANPELAQKCRAAAEALSKIQAEYLSRMTEEITYSFDTLMDSEFMLSEFVDRFGPRLAHMNGMLQVLSQLAAGPETPPRPNQA